MKLLIRPVLIAVLAVSVFGSNTESLANLKPKTDWSRSLVESTMKRYPTAKDLGSWGYAKSLFLWGEYLTWKRTHDPRYLEYIKNWVDSHLDSSGTVTNTNAEGKVVEVKFENLDSMLPGNLMIALYQETKDEKYKLAAEKIRKRFDTYPRTSDGGFWHANTKSREWQLWGDGVFMSMTFLIRYGKAFNDSRYTNDEATRQLLTYASHLNDPATHLMFHAYDESGASTWIEPGTKHSKLFWCRAMGWFGMTLVETLDILPKNHPKRQLLLSQLSQLIEAWSKYQDPKTGLWFQIVDKGDLADNWLETSSSCMYSYVIATAVQRGWVPKRYMDVAKKGYEGALTKISVDGDGMTNLVDICEGTNVGDLAYYLGRKRNTNDFHGLGAFLIMNERLARIFPQH
jgi:unsaturated rhamnogalacturonyl hydrolase